MESRLVLKNDEQSCKQTEKEVGLRKSFSKNIMKVYLVTLKMHKTEIVETRVVAVSLLCIFLFSVIM